MLRDKVAIKRHYRVMDVFPAALKATWAADPGFQELAKFLYGDEVTLEEIAKDLGVAKSEPDQADVHIPGNSKKKLNLPPQVNEAEVEENLKRVKKAGNAFIELVSKAHEAGLIDNDGNLATEEIAKSRDYIRDHAGRFANSGARTVGGFAAAGLLAGGGAVLASKAPEAVKYAGEASGFVAHHLVSKDPVERHVARALLPHAMRSVGEAVGHAGGGAVLGAGGVMEGTRTYSHMRRVGKPETSDNGEIHKDWAKYDQNRKNRRTAVGVVGGVLAVNAAAGAAGGVHDVNQEINRRMAESDARAKDIFDSSRASSTAQLVEDNQDTKLKRLRTRADRKWFGGSNETAHATTGFANGDEFQVKSQTIYGRKTPPTGALQDFKLINGKTALGRDRVIWSATKEGVRDARKFQRAFGKSHEVTWEGEFSKVDEDKRQVFGWASVTEVDGEPVVDLQGDYIHPEELEKAAYDYVLKSRVGGDMHSRVDEFGNKIEKTAPLHISDMIESMVFTPEKVAKLGLPEGALPTGWWVGFKINDEPTWNLVKSGERTGFSIHGQGVRKELGTIQDPEDFLVGKAFEESSTPEEFAANLDTIGEVTGMEGFSELAKHLSHGMYSQQTGHTALGAGIGGAAGGAIGGLAGIASGKGSIGEAVGSKAGTLAGMTAGATAGFAGARKKGITRPVRPPSVSATLGQGQFAKAVSTSNRKGTAGHVQDYYTQLAVQQATEQMAPQVAQHIEALQQQRMAEMMAQQQMMAQNAQQAPQDFTIRIGPNAGSTYGSHGMTQSTQIDPANSGIQQMQPNTARQGIPGTTTSLSGGRNG